MPVEALAFLAGIAAGVLGALIGIGGGVLLVPLLNGVMGLPFDIARGVSQAGVLATSVSGTVAPTSRRLVNYRLAVFLLAFSIGGALLGYFTLDLISDDVGEGILGAAMATIAVIMLLRRNIRNVLPAETPDLGPFGARFFDDDTRREVAYRLRRPPLAAAVSFASGLLASYIGIGGGIVIVPTLNALCGIPLRVAAATSVMMIGVTVIPGLAWSWSKGHLGDVTLAAATVLGALAGYQLGLRLSPRSPVRVIKTGTAVLLAIVAIQYLFLR